MKNRIRKLRLDKDITQKELGLKIGAAESTVSLYESGKRQPDNETLIRIADFFGVSVDYLICRTNNPINYEDGDLIAELSTDLLDAFDGDVKKVLEIQKAIDNDAMRDSAEMYFKDVLETFKRRPELQTLFSSSKKATTEDIIRASKFLDAMRDDSDV